MRRAGLLLVLVILVLTGCRTTTGVEAKPSSRAGIQKPTKVFILSGQSNMVGKGEARDLPPELRMQDNVLIWGEDGGWTPLQPNGSFGPEVSFAAEMTKAWPDEEIGIIKFAVSGSSLEKWKPTLQTDGGHPSLYRRLINIINDANAKTPGGIELAGILWMQGERDSWREKLAKVYRLNLRALIENARKDVGRTDLPFVIGRVNPNYRHVGLVRRAQEEAPRTISRTAMVNCDDIPKKRDNLHYDTRGQILLGKRFATAYLELVKP